MIFIFVCQTHAFMVDGDAAEAGVAAALLRSAGPMIDSTSDEVMRFLTSE